MNHFSNSNQSLIPHIGRQVNEYQLLSDLHTFMEAGKDYYIEYNRLIVEKEKLAVEQDRIQVMRQEILAKYEHEKHVILAKLVNRDMDRQYIQALLTQAIQSSDKEMVAMGFELYKHFLTHNTI